jgi:hypothetical protein
VIALAVIVVALGAWLFWGFNHGPSLGDLRRVADTFDPPAGWSFTSEYGHSRSPFCVDIRCPSFHRRWTFGDAITSAELEALVRDAGWTIVEGVPRDCAPDTRVSSLQSICSVDATSDDVQIALFISADMTEREPFMADLFVNP